MDARKSKTDDKKEIYKRMPERKKGIWKTRQKRNERGGKSKYKECRCCQRLLRYGTGLEGSHLPLLGQASKKSGRLHWSCRMCHLGRTALDQGKGKGIVRPAIRNPRPDAWSKPCPALFWVRRIHLLPYFIFWGLGFLFYFFLSQIFLFIIFTDPIELLNQNPTI